MTIRTMILSALLCLLVFPLITYAKIDYISLHEIESSVRQPLSVKLNIVEIHQKNQLMFTLVNQNAETALEYQRINSHMLRLKSPHYIIGKASILVYVLDKNAWRKTHSVDISNTLTITEVDKKSLKNAAKTTAKCLIIHKPKETLWNIASRYKDKWNVDIFSAMIAIYKTNLSKFTHQHIGLLMINAELLCPTRKTIALMGEKPEMKTEFFRLKSPHYRVAKTSGLPSKPKGKTRRKAHSDDNSNALASAEKNKKRFKKVAKTTAKCLITHEPKETLWNIASRYKDKWNIDIFSAMLAIYKTNQSKFTHQHIGQLMINAELLCPTRKTIALMGEKNLMKAEFIRLKNSPSI